MTNFTETPPASSHYAHGSTLHASSNLDLLPGSTLNSDVCAPREHSNGSASLHANQTSSNPFEPRSSTKYPITDAPESSHATASTTARTQQSDHTIDGNVGSLRISTDVQPSFLPLQSASRNQVSARSKLSPPRSGDYIHRKTSSSSLKAVSRTPSLKTALANSFRDASYQEPHSAGSSVMPSPLITALGEMTPLPSPLMSGDSPGPWKRLSSGGAASTSPTQSRSSVGNSGIPCSPDRSGPTAGVGGSQRKTYGPLDHGGQPRPPTSSSQASHERDRSISDYLPGTPTVPKRLVTVSGAHGKQDVGEDSEPHMRREQHLAESRGLTPTTAAVPTPPASDSSKASFDSRTRSSSMPGAETFEAVGRHDSKKRRWRALCDLGQGTFSRVVLATSDMGPCCRESGWPDRKTLVAIKICEHGPKGGASEERIEMSLKRELEIMQAIHHPSLIDLKAWSVQPSRAVLVLGYSPGGDLFDVATQHRNLVTPALLRRICAELVGALQCLHEKLIVHRDIKLENVLVNLEPSELVNSDIDWASYPYPVITLTDLGLSRRVTPGEKLETRCGSEDYAAPEVIMGQSYDGRSTDAWSLGVLLYALLEARLPFDPHPGMSESHRMRSRTSHRIARIDWVWVEFAGEDGDHDGSEAKFQEKGLLGAMQITEGLLRRERSRWDLDKISQHPWIRNAIKIEGGLRFREEQAGEEVE